jgi:hypothetical protein
MPKNNLLLPSICHNKIIRTQPPPLAPQSLHLIPHVFGAKLPAGAAVVSEYFAAASIQVACPERHDTQLH